MDKRAISARSRSPHGHRAGRRTSTLTPDEDRSVARASTGKSIKPRASADPELVERVRTLLKSYLAELESEHSYVVRNDIRMAMQAVKASGVRVVDKVSPFKNVKPISVRTRGDLQKGQYTGLSIRRFSGIKNAKSEFKLFVPKKVAISPTSSNGIPPVPAFHEYTSLRGNIMAEDDEEMRYCPYIGEDGQKSEELSYELGEAYVDKTRSASDDAKQTEKAILYADFLHKFLADAGVDIECVKSYLIGDLPGSDSMKKVRDFCLPSDFDFTDVKIINAKEKLKQFQITDLKKAEAVCKVFTDITRISLWEVVKRVDLGLQASINPMRSTQAGATLAAGGSSTALTVANLANSANPLVDSYAYMYCQICHMFRCQFHGDIFESISLSLPKTCTRKEAAISPFAAKVPCSTNCFVLSEPGSKPATVKFSALENALIKQASQIFSKNPRAPCLIATVVNRPCSAIYAELRSKNLLRIEKAAEVDDDDGLTILKHKRKRHGGLESYPADCKLAGVAEERDAPKPCTHSGPCHSNCPCVIAKVTCEKFCLCDKSCARRWKGCNCHITGTTCGNPNRCDCRKWGRECDPDLCHDCGAKQALLPTTPKTDPHSALCRNVPIQKDRVKRTLIGVSNLSGIGLFIGEDVEADEYLGEYKGEIVSHNEAERRGKIYDIKRVSFLFNLNRDQAVDATRSGNKFRFVNHYRKPNCYARISLVNSVHRIGMYAKRKLYAGEELYFNYGYNHKTVEFVEGEPKYHFDAPSSERDLEYEDETRHADELRRIAEGQGDDDSSFDESESPRRTARWNLEDSGDDSGAPGPSTRSPAKKTRGQKKRRRGG